jgi:hypothetical protein
MSSDVAVVSRCSNIVRHVATAGAIGALMVACSTSPPPGRSLALEAFDGSAEGAPLDDGVPYFSFSIRSTMPVDTHIEILSLEAADIEGPVQVDAVLALPADHEQRPFSTDPTDNQRYIDALRDEQLTGLGNCGEELCEVVFAVVARRTSSSESGVVKGIEIRYRVDGREYVERTTFAVGLCLPTEPQCT